VITALLLAAASASGQGLTPDDVVDLAIERSGTLRAAWIDVELKGRGRSVTLKPAELRLGHQALDGPLGTPYANNDGQAYAPLDDAFVALRWTLPSPADALAAVAAQLAAEADRYDVVELERDFAASVHALHAQVLSLRAEAGLAKQALETAEQLERHSHAMLSAHVATELDTRLTSLEHLDAAAEAAAVASEAVRAEHELAGLIGARPPLSLIPGERKLCTAPSTSVEDLIARARLRSESLAEHAARRERARAQQTWSWLRFVPYLDAVQLGWHNEPLAKRDSVNGRVDIALPFFFEAFSATSTIIDLEGQRADAMYAEEERQIDARVRSAASRLERAAAVVELHEAREKDVVDASLTDVARALDAGHIDVLRVAEVQRRAMRGRRSLVRARLRCEQAAIELLRVTGELAPRAASGVSDGGGGSAGKP
jgi:outer membrane protein TolC